MTSSRPYLIRAIHDWIVDNNFTPYLLIKADAPGLLAPQQYAQNGKLILNISANAIQALSLGNDNIEFSARFNGVAMNVVVPTEAVLAVYAKENGKGMVFSEEDGSDKPPPGPPEPPKSGKPSLKVVK
jgi:stringent starvation protein B